MTYINVRLYIEIKNNKMTLIYTICIQIYIDKYANTNQTRYPEKSSEFLMLFFYFIRLVVFTYLLY